MKKTYILLILSLLFTINSFSQRQVSIRKLMDTSSVEFQSIYKLWQDYQNDSFLNDFKGTNHDLQKYWYKGDIEKYGDKFDLYKRTIGSYYIFGEFFIGINKRNDTLFEIQTSYYNNRSETYELFYVINIPVIKVNNEYKLSNMFSLKKKDFLKENIGFVNFYYLPNTKLDLKNAKQMVEKCKKVYNDFGFETKDTIDYYIFEDLSTSNESFGIKVALSDYSDPTKKIIDGKAINSKLLIYTIGGERNVHEFLHILCKKIRNNDNHRFFDEGFCSYFGDHQGLDYNTQKSKLIDFLNLNPKVDLSISLTDAYKDKDNKFVSDSNLVEDRKISRLLTSSENQISYSYMIMATICEIAFKQGGYNKVKQMIIDSQEGEEFYDTVDKHLGIKRKDVNNYIRSFLNKD